MPATRRSARSQARKNLPSPSPPVSIPRKPRRSTPADQSDEEPEADSKSGVTSNDEEDTPEESAEKIAKPLAPSRRRRARASPGVAPSEQVTSPAARHTRRRTSNEPADTAPSDVGEPDTVDEDAPLLPLHAETGPDNAKCDKDSIADDTSVVVPEDITHSSANVIIETEDSARPVLMDNPNDDSGPEILSDTNVVETEPETHQANADDPSRNDTTRPDQTSHATRSLTRSSTKEAQKSFQSTLPVRKESEEPIRQEAAFDEGLLDERKPVNAGLLTADKGTLLNLSDLSHVMAPSPDEANEDKVASPPEEMHIESEEAKVVKPDEGSETRADIESIPTNDAASIVNGKSEGSSSPSEVIVAGEVVVFPAGAHIEAETKPTHGSTATGNAVAYTSAQLLLDGATPLRIDVEGKETVEIEEEGDEAVLSSGTIEGGPLTEVEANLPPSVHFAGQSLAALDVSTVGVDIKAAIACDSSTTQQGMLEAQRSDTAVVDLVETVKGQEEMLEGKEVDSLVVGSMQPLQKVAECVVGGDALGYEQNDGAEHHELEMIGEGILEANASCQKDGNDDADLQEKILAMDERIPEVNTSSTQKGFSDRENASAMCFPPRESIIATPGLITDESNAEHMHAKNSDARLWDGSRSAIQERVPSTASIGTGEISTDKECLMTKVHDTTFEYSSQHGTTNGISQEEQHVLTLEYSESCSLLAPMLVRSQTSQNKEQSADFAASDSGLGNPKFKASHETLSQTGCNVAKRVQGVGKPQASVQAIKVRIYCAGVVAHRGKGAEKSFASYWGALCRCFGTRFQGDGSDKRAWMLKGSREVIKKFLTTKKLRRLHNALILGLMNRCVDDTASVDDVAAHVPSPWRNRVHIIHKDDARHRISIESHEFETAIKSDFQTQSRLWTSAGVSEELFTIPENVRPSLSFGVVARTDDISPPLPGALLVDPYVRSTAQREGLKVAENAVWLVVVGMREYVKSLLKNTIATIDSVNEVRELSRGSALVTQSRPIARARDVSTAHEDFVPTSTTNMPGKRKRVSALDVAACLMSSPVNNGRSANRLAIENCYLSAFDVHPATSLGGFESIRSYVASGITIASPKRPRTQNDSHFQPPDITPQGGVAETKTIPDRPQPHIQSNRPSAKSGSVPPPHPTQARRSPSIKGMGRGAKNLEALKARAAAAASAAKNDTHATGASSASHQTVTMNDNAEPAKPSTKPTEGTPLPPEPRSAPFQSSNPRHNFPMLQKGSAHPSERLVAESTDGSKLAVERQGTIKVVAPSASESEIPLGMVPIDRKTAQFGSHGTLKSVEKQLHEGSSSAEKACETGQVLDSGTMAAHADTSIAQRPAARGRGFGVKNLAMMRARSAGGIVDTKDEGSNADDGKNSDVWSTAGAQGVGCGSKAEGDDGSTAKADLSKLLEAREAASEPIAASEPECKPSLDQKFDGKGHNEPVTNVGMYQQMGSVETLQASSEVVAQLSEQGKPLAYKV